jgi:murein DD-endopeptidase MepM/ murein hydrolase activator NlpD
MRKVLVVVVLVVVAFGATFVIAGRSAGPSIHVLKPQKFVGLKTPVEIDVEAPGGRVSSVRATFEQNGQATTLVEQGATAATDASNKVHVSAAIGRDNVPALKTGPARITVTAVRPVLFGLRSVQSTVTSDVQVRLERPRLTVLSTHHYINQGGAEAIVYRAEPADVESGVRVGDIEYPGYPASGAAVGGASIADPTVRIAFFALMYDQPASAPMRVYARDEAGNSIDADFDRKTFPKPTKKSRIELTDAYIDRVVPAILATTTEVKPEGTTLEKFLVLNGELRRKNAATIASFASKTSPQLLWGGVPFHPFTNSAVESAFADARTYVYQGRDVDHQTHLGFDLAKVVNTPIVASNRGKVLYADDLGIYGRTVIIDHGMGLQSLYAHLSSITVKVGDEVQKEQELGRSGMTGMAAGDHLHYTMLVAGHMVNPIEWWDPHWIEDRVLRKLREAR